MRKAAALAFAVPGLEVDVRSAGEVVARVRRTMGDRNHAGTYDSDDTDDACPAIVCPAAFRSAVGQALTGRTTPLPFLDLNRCPTMRPSLFMPFTGATRRWGMVVARLGEVIVHVFATTRPPSEAMSALERAGCHPSIAVTVDASWDAMTQITLVHAESRICDLTIARPHIEAMMDAAFLHLAVEEITTAVAATTTRPATQPATENRQDQP